MQSTRIVLCVSLMLAPATAAVANTNHGQRTQRGVSRVTPQPELAKHIRFFDLRNRGYVTIPDAYRGMRSIKDPARRPGRLISAAGATLSVIGLGAKSWGKKGIRFSLNVAGAHRTKHLASTMLFALDGSFDAARFDHVFSTYDKGNKEHLTSGEIAQLLADSAARDKPQKLTARIGWLAGKVAAKFELPLLLKLAGENIDGQQVIKRETLRSFYNGRLLYQLAGRAVPEDL